MFENYNGGIENTKGEKFKEIKKYNNICMQKKKWKIIMML